MIFVFVYNISKQRLHTSKKALPTNAKVSLRKALTNAARREYTLDRHHLYTITKRKRHQNHEQNESNRSRRPGDAP
eukprot:jgi/Antlo1/717/2296